MSEQVDLESIAEQAIGELKARLDDHPKDMTDGVLVRLATEANKIMDRREKDQGEDEEARPFEFWEQIDGLPADRATELVLQEEERLVAELARVNAWLKSPPA